MQNIILLKNLLIKSVQSEYPNLSMRQLAVLLFLFENTDEDKTTVKFLSELLNISKPAITRAIDRLEELGFVTRKVNKLDRRIIFVVLTDKVSDYVCFLNDNMGSVGNT